MVDSPAGDLLITAAHCVTGRAPGTIAFVPGYHTGHEPYGIWPVKQVIADNDWLSSGNPDHDVAFLIIRTRHNIGKVRVMAWSKARSCAC